VAVCAQFSTSIVGLCNNDHPLRTNFAMLPARGGRPGSGLPLLMLASCELNGEEERRLLGKKCGMGDLTLRPSYTKVPGCRGVASLSQGDGPLAAKLASRTLGWTCKRTVSTSPWQMRRAGSGTDRRLA